MQAVGLLGAICIALLLMEYLTTMRSITQREDFQEAGKQMKQHFALSHVTIVRFQRPEEYRIIFRTASPLPSQDVLPRLEEIGRYFEKRYAPRPLTEKIRVVYMKEVGRGFSYKAEKIEKILERKALFPKFLQKEVPNKTPQEK